MTGSAAELFDAQYYATGCGRKYERNEEWLVFFGRIAERMIADIGPQTVLDAGCAIGLLVESLRTRGIGAFGRDISSFAIGSVYPSIAPYCELGSIADPLRQRYDLIVSIEVLEHMQPDESRAAIANLCRYTDDILFSSTPFDYKEATHFNVQPPEYWAELFAQQGFFRDVDYDASYITEWAVRFRRRSDPIHRIVRDYERGYWILHKENQELRNLAMEMRRAAETTEPSPVAPVRPADELAAAPDDLSVELAKRDLALEDMRNRWRALEGSPGYALMRGLQSFRNRVAPPLSSRDQILEATLQILRAHNLPTLRTQSSRIGYEIRQQVGAARRRV